MTTEGERNSELTDQMLSDMVRDADEYYAQLRRRHVSETRLHVAIVGVVVWFAAFHHIECSLPSGMSPGEPECSLA